MKKLTLVLVVFIFSCSKNESLNSQQAIIPSDNSVIGDGEIKLIWSDEFEIDGPPSPQNWFLETVPPNNGSWWNEEDQYYTNRRKNSIVENGVLKIIALREDYENKKYTSARMTTQNLFDFTYGEVHVRAKLPQGQGTWPAIWMLGNDIGTLNWPQCGEIDIMEHGNKEAGLVSSAVHLANENGDHYYLSGQQKIENESNNFHIYKVKWSSTQIDFFVDDIKHHTFITNFNMPFWKPFFLLLNVAMGGQFTNNNIDSDFISATMEVDYVRVYQ